MSSQHSRRRLPCLSGSGGTEILIVSLSVCWLPGAGTVCFLIHLRWVCGWSLFRESCWTTKKRAWVWTQACAPSKQWKRNANWAANTDWHQSPRQPALEQSRFQITASWPIRTLPFVEIAMQIFSLRRHEVFNPCMTDCPLKVLWVTSLYLFLALLGPWLKVTVRIVASLFIENVIPVRSPRAVTMGWPYFLPCFVSVWVSHFTF